MLVSQKPVLLQTLGDLTSKLDDSIAQARALHSSIKDGDFKRDHGVSFLEVKHQILLEYDMQLALFMMLKIDGHKIEGHPVVGAFGAERVLSLTLKIILRAAGISSHHP